MSVATPKSRPNSRLSLSIIARSDQLFQIMPRLLVFLEEKKWARQMKAGTWLSNADC